MGHYSAWQEKPRRYLRHSSVLEEWHRYGGSHSCPRRVTAAL